MPEAATAGTPMPGKMLSPQHIRPGTPHSPAACVGTVTGYYYYYYHYCYYYYSMNILATIFDHHLAYHIRAADRFNFTVAAAEPFTANFWKQK